MRTKDETFAENLAKKVEARMYYLRINRAELGRVSGLAQETIRKILNYECYSPTENTLDKLAFGLAMTKEQLIDFTI